MKVYFWIYHYYNGCDSWDTVERVFDDEVKAVVWVDDFQDTESEGRTYREVEVEWNLMLNPKKKSKN